MKRTISGAITKNLLRLSITLASFFAMGALSAFAASIYQVAPTTATVGTAVSTFEAEYTVDTAVQTWADADTLTLVIPANFPGWDAWTFTAEYDTDVTNDATGETAITVGGGNGQYAIGGAGNRTLTIKWDVSTWGAVSNGASTIRVLGTAANAPTYADSTSTFTFGGTTAAGGDTNPSGTADIDVSASDAGATVTLANAAVGASQATTINFTLGYAMANTDTVVFTLPANLDVSGVDSADITDTFGGAGAFTCTDAAQVITCTADDAITAGAGTIVIAADGVTAKYAATGSITSFAVNDTSESGADISSDASGTVTDSVASDAAASVTLAGNAVVGQSGNTTLSFTLGYAMANTDTVIFTLPNNLNVDSIAFASDTFGGAGTFTCTKSNRTLTCTADGVINAGAGTLVFTGVKALYAATGQTVTSLAVNDTSASGADISSDASGAVTNTTSNVSTSDDDDDDDTTTTTTTDDDDTTTTTDEDTTTSTTDEDTTTTTDEDTSTSEEEDTTSETDETSLTDVATHWAKTQIDSMTTAGIIKGNADGTFKPDTNLNRAEAAAFLYRVLGLDEPTAPSEKPFSDVAVDSWYAGYVAYLKGEAYVAGYSDGTYGPAKMINRAEFLTLAMNVYYAQADEATKAEIDGYKAGVPTTMYSDLDATAWYEDVVTASTKLGFIQGSACGESRCVRAGENITRAEAATILYNMFKVMLGLE